MIVNFPPSRPEPTDQLPTTVAATDAPAAAAGTSSHSAGGSSGGSTIFAGFCCDRIYVHWTLSMANFAALFVLSLILVISSLARLFRGVPVTERASLYGLLGTVIGVWIPCPAPPSTSHRQQRRDVMAFANWEHVYVRWTLRMGNFAALLVLSLFLVLALCIRLGVSSGQLSADELATIYGVLGLIVGIWVPQPLPTSGSRPRQ